VDVDVDVDVDVGGIGDVVDASVDANVAAGCSVSVSVATVAVVGGAVAVVETSCLERSFSEALLLMLLLPLLISVLSLQSNGYSGMFTCTAAGGGGLSVDAAADGEAGCR